MSRKSKVESRQKDTGTVARRAAWHGAVTLPQRRRFPRLLSTFDFQLSTSPQGWNRLLVLGALALVALSRLVWINRLPLLPDEAYYWDWSRRLALGYFDHPP